MADLVLYAIFGAILGIVWSLRKIYTLEIKIDNLEKKIVGNVGKRKK